ncbi:MAG TPA: hypothetical protein VMD47_06035 [Candidatus Acidoferrales bacterium]|nr:hypothetical protein [Candidatus Acidoferrales bacterium]
MIVETLGIRREHRVCLRGITNPLFAAAVVWQTEYPPSRAASGRFDIIVLQVNEPHDLDEIARLARHLEPTGGLWVLHGSGDAAQVQATGFAEGLVVTKRCEYSVTHVATRLSPRVRVIRGTI